jgi:cell shape-determining protein MreD
MGPGMLSYGILGTALAHTKRMVNLRKMPYQGLVIFVVGFLAGTLRYFFMFLAGNTEGINPHVDLLWEPLYSAVIGPFLFLPVGWWMRIKVQRFTR